ncbi:malate dehydrogenase (quinone) [Pustulibacterium marinum]|uniref:Probable malate:quinone oxidoreductase n=1 Tax=Pustulibacterium marinum TaxID=1224947 RepID=A0A1I7ET54_9FLAO|nr:malate dehydrogenase (quinone) [Pustulibacterium marinum]SFU27100.1 malate dehydrogenase (quinone) [Pustulibacterium marinum]
MSTENVADTKQVVLIGAGIMSATLATLLKKLNPGISISIFEKLDVISGESSNATNNAGTGHSGFCELNYTPQKEDGSVDISKAINVAKSFELSREFWSFLVKEKTIINPQEFIQAVPHMSFVWGEENIDFLKKRWELLKEHPLFKGMEFSDDWDEIASWIPLMMENRSKEEKVAVTKMPAGTDVNFGELTRKMLLGLFYEKEIDLHMAHEVKDIHRNSNGKWEVKVKNLTTKKKSIVEADFVFVGAGGRALNLLEKSKIEEIKGFGGFPVSGEWLVCNNEEVIKNHHAKVYGKAKVGAPPMSVPHLDTRLINGKPSLLFGPFAGFSTKFLKNGSYWDFFDSMKKDNIGPMLSAGAQNIPLTRYLIEQVRQDKKDKIESLREYFPNAKSEDWDQKTAGQRVQVIKKSGRGGILQFGTEVVSCKDGSLAGLLGASPGASTAVAIMIDLLQQCFPEKFESEWKAKIQEMIPSYGKENLDEAYYNESRNKTAQALGLSAISEDENIPVLR